VLVVPQVVLGDAEIGVPAGALVDPVLVPLLIRARLDEVLQSPSVRTRGSGR